MKLFQKHFLDFSLPNCNSGRTILRFVNVKGRWRFAHDFAQYPCPPSNLWPSRLNFWMYFLASLSPSNLPDLTNSLISCFSSILSLSGPSKRRNISMNAFSFDTTLPDLKERATNDSSIFFEVVFLSRGPLAFAPL